MMNEGRINVLIGCKEEDREICIIEFGETNSIFKNNSRKTWVGSRGTIDKEGI